MQKAFHRAADGVRRAAAAADLLTILLLLAAPSQAQVQRSMINLGFEVPAVNGPCWRYIAAAAVPGWNTNAPSTGTHTTDCAGAPIAGTTPSGPPIEIWGTGLQGVISRSGSAHAELNADLPSRLSQNVCLLNGEVVGWRLSHRGRSTTTPDVMELKAGAATVARMSTSINTTATVVASQGNAQLDGRINGWADYSGQFTYNGATGQTDIGFEAITSSVGINGGNHLDEIQVTLRPFVEFVAPAYSMDEARPSLNIPRLRVAGTVPAGGMNVPVTITGGTATLGADYTTPGNAATFTVFIPAGTYDLNTFALPVTPIDDGVGDPDETINFSTPVTTPTDPYNLASLNTCGAQPQATTTATLAEGTPILPRLQLNKALSSTRVAASDQFQLRITGPNGQAINTTGTGSTIANGSIQAAPATVGTTYTISEVMAPGSVTALTTYAPSISCTNANPTSSTVLPSGAGSSFNVTIGVNDNISCTLTNRATNAVSGLSVVKSVTSGSQYANAGDVATYQYVVTNTGATSLNTLAVTDNKIAAVSCGGVTTLAIGASVTCTGSYTITQADVDAAIVTNVVQARARNPSAQMLYATDDAVINLALPSLRLDKATTATAYATIGEQIPYTYLLTNDGNVTINSLSVSDDKIALVSCPVTSLAPGASTTCSGTHTVTQADIDAGALTNRATATGVPAVGIVSPVLDQVTLPGPAATASLALDKSVASGQPFSAVGDVVTYEYRVTNTGNVSISNLTVSDDKIATVTCPVSTLASGTSTICTGGYTITQADLDAGSVTNNASATGTPARGALSPAIDSQTVTATPLPAWTLEKSVTSGAPFSSVGQVVTYAYLVTNTGNVTINNVAVSDDKIATVFCPVTTLAPGASTTCTGNYAVNQADLDAGAVTNNASATGTSAQGSLLPATDSATAMAHALPALTLDKSATGGAPFDAVGDMVTYSYSVTNTGNVTIQNLAVSDDKIATVTCPVTSLEPGASTICTASYSITQSDLDAGSVTNNARADGAATQGTLSPASDSVSVSAESAPALSLSKSAVAGAPFGVAGDVVSYQYVVANIGNVTIRNLAVSDDKIATLSCPMTTLVPGASTTCTGNYTITQADMDAGSVTNNASATGTPTQGTLAPATDSETAAVAAAPSLTLEKRVAAGNPYDSVGDLVDYTYEVTNTGNVTINALAVTDDKIASVACPVTTLAPGVSTTCTASYTIVQADLDAGAVTNNATANGAPAQGSLSPATDSAVATSSATPALTLAKTATSGVPYDAAGDVVTYQYVVTNPSTVTINAISVSDDKIATVNCPQSSLAPAASMTCTASYTVTQADLDAGSVTNNAVANGVPTSGVLVPGGDSATVDADTNPSLTLDKRAVSGSPYDSVGDVIGYDYVLTNTGNVSISAPAVSDDRIAAVNCPSVTLAPGQSTTCTATHTVTQADLDAGSVINHAVGSGVPAQRPLPPATDTETADADERPALTLEKMIAAGSPFDAVGDDVSYDYLVTNTGNVTVSALQVTDDKIATVTCPVSVLAPGESTSCTGTYLVTQADLDAGGVTNHASVDATPANGTLPPASDQATANAAPAPALSLDKRIASGNPFAAVGDAIAYEYVVTNTGNVTVDSLAVVDDKIPTITCPVATLAPGASTLCTGTYTVTQADLDAGAVTNNATANGTPAQGALTSATDSITATATTTPGLTMVKTAVRGVPYRAVGDIVGYDYLVTNTGNVSVSSLVVADDKIAAVNCPVTTLAPGASTTCTADYPVTQADLDAGSVTNHATADGTPAQGTLVPGTAQETAAAGAVVTYEKAANTAGPVVVGDTISYALTVTVKYATTSYDKVLTDTLGAGLSFDRVTAPGAFVCNSNDNTLTCTLPAGQPPGVYTVGYTAVVNADATGTVNNAVVAASNPSDPAPPSCGSTCNLALPVTDPSVTYAKVADTAGPVKQGDTITYTLSATVTNSQTTAITTLTDTLGIGLAFAGVTDSGAYDCSASGNVLACTLPAGTAPGTYPVTYSANVTAQAPAGGTVDNVVTGSSADGKAPACDGICTVAVNVAAAVVDVNKTSDPASGEELEVGRTIEYTLTATIANAALNADLVLTDTPDSGLTVGTLPSGCNFDGAQIACILPAGTTPGTYSFSYPATINDQADVQVGNNVVAVSSGNLTVVNCASCSTLHTVAASDLRIAKVAAIREVRIGDFVRYTLTVANTGSGRLRNGSIIDTPPAGFTYVEGSLVVDDADDAGTVSGQRPLRFAGIDIGGGESATLVYLMRVGAGVRPGVHENHAQAFSPTTGQPISNLATAKVELVADPLMDDSLIFGTVFNDCDGDGWQDEGERGVPGVRIASVEGLLTETDQFGRYHLAGIPGGAWERGRNFILKVDPSTLPDGAQFTTDNPLTRRITPGVPVRFDWGVKRCVVETRELQLGTVFFAPGSAEVQRSHDQVIGTMAARIDEYGGGDVVIDASGDSLALAFNRAESVKQALLAKVAPPAAKNLRVVARGKVDDPGALVAGVDEGGALLGTVLFDTDAATIRAEFAPLLDAIAKALRGQGGGVVTIVGHTDARASRAYNTALGLRRAKAVADALQQRLPADVRERVRIETNDDPAAPVDLAH